MVIIATATATVVDAVVNTCCVTATLTYPNTARGRSATTGIRGALRAGTAMVVIVMTAANGIVKDRFVP